MIYRNVKKHPLSEAMVRARKRVRSVYSTEAGMEELFNMFHDFGLFRVISPEQLDARNRMILKAEEMGLLEEDVVRDVLKTLMTTNLVDEIEKDKVARTKEVQGI